MKRSRISRFFLIYGFFGITAFGRRNAGFGSDCIKKDRKALFHIFEEWQDVGYIPVHDIGKFPKLCLCLTLAVINGIGISVVEIDIGHHRV